MSMKREVIADKGIWTAKKRYILNAWDIEGVKYKEPTTQDYGYRGCQVKYACTLQTKD